MLITAPATRTPKPDLHAATVHRQGHHKDHGNVAFENDAKVLLIDQPTADEIDQRLGWASPEPEREKSLHQAADFVGVLAAWFAESNCISSAGAKAWAGALLLRPHCCPERNASRLAAHFGVTKQMFSKYLSQLHRMANGMMRSPALRSDAFRKQRSAIAREYHRRAGHRLHPRRKA
jgi:hypothetical protein